MSAPVKVPETTAITMPPVPTVMVHLTAPVTPVSLVLDQLVIVMTKMSALVKAPETTAMPTPLVQITLVVSAVPVTPVSLVMERLVPQADDVKSLSVKQNFMLAKYFFLLYFKNLFSKTLTKPYTEQKLKAAAYSFLSPCFISLNNF
jgi:hypothetical protein